MRCLFLGLLAAVSGLALGCGVSSSEGGTGFTDGEDVGDGSVPSANGSEGTAQSGLLTAGDWDDNLNFDLFQSYVANHAPLTSDGYSVDYYTGDRVTIRVVTPDGQPVAGAEVLVASDAQTVFSAPTASDGRVLFFPQHDGASGGPLSVEVLPPADQPGAQPTTVLSPEGSEWEVTLTGAEPAPVEAIDLAFVIDTTGSMSDEIHYLQKELQDIVSDVKQDHPGVSMRFALIVYRDHGDAYVVQDHDFTASIDDFQEAIDKQSADGGGDTPEAMDEALAHVSTLTWRPGPVARMAVLVADAPPHEEQAQKTADEIDDLRAQGIRLYPLAASGVDVHAEFLMRLGAEATGGRYMFLTDDSGVGDPHMEPTIPCYQVRKLKDVLSYEIATELTGVRAPVPSEQVIRDVGDPEDGVCKLEDQTEARLW